MTDATYGIIDPDYARVFTIARCIAWAEGYALAMHGSFTRDLDMIAVPWQERVCDPEHLVNRIVDSADLKITTPDLGDKLHGRKAWTLKFQTFGDPRFIDFSVYTTPPAQVAVTEAMVDRGIAALLEYRGTYEGEVPIGRDDVRVAIQAALTTPPAPVAVSDAALGTLVWEYIDRMNDPCPADPAENILADFVKAARTLVEAALTASAGKASEQGEGS